MEKKKNWILWGLAWLVNIKMIFLDYGADSGYVFAMSQRMLDGDGMFREMWEPHQTSAFALAFLMRIYEWIVPSRTGLVVGIHFMMAVVFFAISLFLAKNLSRFVEEGLAQLAGFLFFVMRAKMVQVPDYSNLSTIFTVFLFLFLIRYFLGGKKVADLLLAAVSLCLAVLAYPSCLILYVPCVIILFLYSEKKWRDFFTFSACCMAAGAAYVGFFAWLRGPATFLETLLKIWRTDSHSQQRTYVGYAYFEELIIGLIAAGVCFLIAAAVLSLLGRSGRKKPDLMTWGSAAMAAGLCLTRILLPQLSEKPNLAIWALGNVAVFLAVLAGLFGIRKLNAQEKLVYVTGMLLAAGTFVAVALLTNLPLITILGYLYLAVIVSFLPIRRLAAGKEESDGELSAPAKAKAYVPLFCVVAVLLFSQAYLNLNQAQNYVRKGPLFGVVTTLEKCNRVKYGIAEWEAKVSEKDQVLIIQEFALDPMDYLSVKTGIATHSTISTPTYSEKMQEYWQIYPEKEPTVMAVPCWNGQENGAMPSWLREKLDQEYELHDAGTYWNFYFKK